MAERTNKTLFDSPERKPDIPKQLGRGFEKNFDWPLAHRADPPSSFHAGNQALKSGKVKGQMRAVLQTVQKHKGLTSAEIAHVMGCDRHIPARRLANLERRGLIKRGRLRTCGVCKSICLTWWPLRLSNE